MPVYTKEKYSTQEEWLKLRSTGIGGTDIGAIMGYNKYKSPVDVWREKVLGYEDGKETEEMHFGKLLEPIIAKEFQSRYGIKVLPKPKYILRHKEYPFLIASIDYFVEENGKKGVLEIKTTNSYVYKSWEYGLPVYYYLQLQHYLLVSGLEYGYIAVLVNGQNLNKLKFKRDEETIEEIIKAGKEFWENYVIPKIEPPLVEYQKIEHQGSEEASIELLNLYNEIVELENQRDIINEHIEEKKNMLIQLIGDKEVITRDGTPIIFYKKMTRSHFNTKKFQSENPILYEQYLDTQEYYQLRIVKNK